MAKTEDRKAKLLQVVAQREAKIKDAHDDVDPFLAQFARLVGTLQGLLKGTPLETCVSRPKARVVQLHGREYHFAGFSVEHAGVKFRLDPFVEAAGPTALFFGFRLDLGKDDGSDEAVALRSCYLCVDKGWRERGGPLCADVDIEDRLIEAFVS